MNKILIEDTLSEQIFFNAYQLWRNLVRVSEPGSYCCFVIPKERIDLQAEIECAKHLLKEEYQKKVRIYFIDDICNKCEPYCPEHYKIFKEKYLLHK